MKYIHRFILGVLSVLFLIPTLFACQPSSQAGLGSSSEDGSNSSFIEDDSSEDNPASNAPSSPSMPDSTPSIPQTPTPSKNAQYLRITGDSVNLRSGAGTNYTVIGSGKMGETYAVVGKQGAWYETYYRGKRVYVSASYVALTTLSKSADEDVENVINEGYKLLGVPYVYGAVRVHDGNGKLLSGFTAQKFDCSSLVQYVFYKGAKTLLQVNTRTQVLQGKYVDKNALQRGDCIFFTNESRVHLSGIDRIGHVAIYLGDNYILHTASDYARIEKISASRWKYYVEARRFI